MRSAFTVVVLDSASATGPWVESDMDAIARARVEELWAERLGCEAKLLRSAGLHCIPHPQPNAMFVIAVDRAVVAAAPHAFHAWLATLTSPLALLDPETLRGLLPSHARLVGPAFV